MGETTNTVVALTTPELVKAKLQLSLNQEGFQKVQDEADKLIYTEDNLQTIADFLKKGRGLTKVLQNSFEKVKEPYKVAGQVCDAARRDLESVINGIVNPVQTKYETLCKVIDERKRKEKAEQDRKDKIKQGIEINLLQFSQKIAGANTLDEVLAVERNINLEKGRKDKYMEFLPDAVEKFNTLTVAIKDQKEKIRKLDELNKKEAEAKEKQDDEALLNIMEQKEQVQAVIEENKENIQLNAIEEATKETAETKVTYYVPSAKARYSSWKWEIINQEEVIAKYQDKLPAYLMPCPNESFIEEKLAALKAGTELKGKEEYIWEKSVRFYLDKRY